jgi:hypothetical protein
MSETATRDYTYRPSLLGAAWQFSLTEQGLAWSAGRRQGVWPYADIAHIQLSYRPVSMQRRRFRADIRARDGRKLPIVSATWQSMIAVAPQDDAYRNFILDLHRRVAAAGQATFGAGLRRPAYMIGLVLLVFVGVALAGLLLRAISTASWSGVLFLLACVAVFGWQIGSFVRRNRPRTYTPDDVPEDLIPPST